MRYFGVWGPGNDGYYLWANVTWDSFRAKWEELSAQNLRLVDLSTEVVGGEVRYSGVWRAGTGGHYLWVNADWNSFVAKWQELAPQGLRLTVIDSHIVNGSGGMPACGVPGPTATTSGATRAGTTSWPSGASWPTPNLPAHPPRRRSTRHPCPTRPWVRLHFKTLTAPTIPPATMLARMREVYNASGIEVRAGIDRDARTCPRSNDLDVGACTMGNTTAEQNQLFGNRNNVGANDVAVYFVRSTVPPFNGCAAPSGQSARRAWSCRAPPSGPWRHEVGHVLGLTPRQRQQSADDRQRDREHHQPAARPHRVSEVTTMGNSNLTQDW